jgi:hypothetical protein
VSVGKKAEYSWKTLSASVTIPIPPNQCGKWCHSKDFEGRKYRRGRNRCKDCGGYFSNIDLMEIAQKRAEAEQDEMFRSFAEKLAHSVLGKRKGLVR